jgi:hypothetical protein
MPLNYYASPICSSFMKSEAYARILAGPIGSGKTTCCLMEIFRRCCEQKPAEDGKRYTRFAFVRQTLKQMKDTILKDIYTWMPGLGEWQESKSTFFLEFGDIRSEWLFIPLETADEQARLLSTQLTGVWLNEAIECNVDILGPITGRIGRYPSANRGTPTWIGLIADTNMPVELSEWHRLMTEPPNNWQIFIQPSGMAPDAENLNWLLQSDETRALPFNHPDRVAKGRIYYERLLEMYGSASPWTQRYIFAEFGNDPSGEAVFAATFIPRFHVVPETFLAPGHPLIIGQDFGRSPASLLGQVDHTGRLLIHEEILANNIGLEKHIEEHLRPRLYSQKYAGYRSIVVGDPAGVAKSTIAEETSFDALKRLGFTAFPAPTNDIDARLRAVEALLGRQISGGPALCISAKGCPWLVRAMSGGYRFSRAKQGGLRATPEKLDKEGFSHLADALQYLALVVHGNLMPYFLQRAWPRKKPEQVRISAAGWT